MQCDSIWVFNYKSVKVYTMMLTEEGGFRKGFLNKPGFRKDSRFKILLVCNAKTTCFWFFFSRKIIGVRQLRQPLGHNLYFKVSTLLPECVEYLTRRCGQLSFTEAVGVQQEAGLQLLHWCYQTVEAPEQLNLRRQSLGYNFWLLTVRMQK